MMRTAYAVIGWMIVGLGVAHIAATPHYFAEITSRTVWFVSGGLALALAGALNLVNRAYGANAHGLRRLACGANVVMVAFGAFAGTVDRAAAWQFALVLGLFVSAAALSCSRMALRR